MKKLNLVKEAFIEEHQSWPLWLVVFFGAGISVYFSLAAEPPALFLALPLPAFAIVMAFRRNVPLRWVFLSAFFALAGYAAAQLHAIISEAPRIPDGDSVYHLSGDVEDINKEEDFTRLVLSHLRIDGMPPEKTPIRIRVNVRTRLDEGIAPGSRVILRAKLSSPPPPALPGGYDFARQAYFDKIGGVGFAVTWVKKLRDGDPGFIARLRHSITNAVIAAIPGQAGAMSAALITGERDGISEAVNDSMRASGLAHLISISGLHMALVAGVFLFSLRLLLAAAPGIGERSATRKIAGAAALMGSFLYLLISGAPVPAVRSFIMIGMLLLAVIFDREATPMRSVAVAALIILAIWPETLLSPSLQMSFAAVIALVAAYDALRGRVNFGRRKWWVKALIALGSTFFTSIVAGAATSPFSIYHFNNYSIYGMFSNLLAIPVTSFVVMPFAVLSVLLMPFGLEWLALMPVGWGVDLVIRISDFFANLPEARQIVPIMPVWGLAAAALGGLWLCLWTRKWRILGVLPIALGLASPAFSVTPDLILDGGGKFYAMKINGMLYFSDRRKRFSAESWANKFAGGTREKIPPEYCDEGVCSHNGMAVMKKPAVICPKARILADLTEDGSSCRGGMLTVSRRDLESKGTHEIWLAKEAMVKTVSDSAGTRPWNRGLHND